MREKKIVQTSLLAILTNFILVAFKMTIGMIANSLSIILDAVNNLSDVLSSLITIAGTGLSRRSPDKEHPFGHGRYEYLASLIVSSIILYVGIQSIIEAVKLWLKSTEPIYSWWTVLIVTVAIFVKVFLGRYVQQVGREVDSPSLKSSGQDAKNDAYLSAATLLCALASLFFHINIEKYISIVIALFILKSGYDILNETISRILGERLESGLAQSVKEVACKVSGVIGAYDLFLNDYGPDRYFGSLHVEIDDSLSASEIDELSREVMEMVFKETGVTLSAVGIYARNCQSDIINEMRTKITNHCLELGYIQQVHGFFVDTDKQQIRFDIVVPYGISQLDRRQKELREWIKKEYPDHRLDLTIDLDTSD